MWRFGDELETLEIYKTRTTTGRERIRNVTSNSFLNMLITESGNLLAYGQMGSVDTSCAFNPNQASSTKLVSGN